MQHDNEVDSSANVNPQLESPLPQVDNPSPTSLRPRAKPVVPRRTLPHPDTSYPLISPSTQPLAGHILKTLPEPRVPVVPSGGVHLSAPNVKHQGYRWPTHIWPLLSRSCACSRPRRAI